MADNPRAARLKKLLDSIIHAKAQLTKHNTATFLEAVCAQPDPASCVHKIIASTNGLDAIQNAMRYDLSVPFLNGPATSLLAYIQVPELASIGGGTFLHHVLLKIVDPPIFWSAFVQAFRHGSLTPNAQQAFAWLLLQLISTQGDAASLYRDIALDTIDALLESPELDIRALAQKIKHVMSTYATGTLDVTQCGPGGRHDNDFVDYRQVAILPTADEMRSDEPPFLRPSREFDDPTTEQTRLANYLDNQFRLLREDMIYELREELQIAFGKKGGKLRNLIIDGMSLCDKLHYENSRDAKSCKWGIVMQCVRDFHIFKDVKPKDREEVLRENRKFLRHGSMACLIVDGVIIAFPTINRDDELLALDPPLVVIELDGVASTSKTLLRLKTAKNVKLLQIDTALFSYEPVLRALQETISMPLSPEILFWKQGCDIQSSSSSQPTNLIQAIKTNPRQDLQALLATTKSIILDDSQAASLLSGLTQKVSLIQGPPGTKLFLFRNHSAHCIYRNWKIIHWRSTSQGSPRFYAAEYPRRLLHQPRTRSVPGRPARHWHPRKCDGSARRQVHASHRKPQPVQQKAIVDLQTRRCRLGHHRPVETNLTDIASESQVDL